MSRKRIMVVLVMLAVLLFPAFQVLAQEQAVGYSDINGHWAQHMIEEFTERGYLEGYRDGTFRPDHPVTRAEAGTFVSRLGFAEKHPQIGYSDLMENTWYYDAVLKATQTGFVNGYPDGTYRPEHFILREEATKLASLFWGEFEMAGFELGFSDKERVSVWAKEHLEKLVKMELLNGYPDNTIRPRNDLTRAEFVKLFYMILVEPSYTNVTLRAVDYNNPQTDIIEAKMVSRETGSTAVFTAPEVPSRWQLQGVSTQTHMVEQGLEVVFKYRYIQPSSSSGSSGGTPIVRHTLSLTADPSAGGSVSGGGRYQEGEQITVRAEAAEGYEFIAWHGITEEANMMGILVGPPLISSNAEFVYTMLNKDAALVALFAELPPVQECEPPTLIAHSNYNVDQILTITYDEDDGEFETWRSNLSKVVIWQLRYEGSEPIPVKLIEIDLPSSLEGIDISTPGQVTFDPSIIEELQEAGYEYRIDIVGEQGCETSVIQYVQAGAVAALDYYIPPLEDNKTIEPSTEANYIELDFVTTRIIVVLRDQYDNLCSSGPSYSAFVYAEENGVNEIGWIFSSIDLNNDSLEKNMAVSDRWGEATFTDLTHAIGTGTLTYNEKYITFRVYLPGENHDETGHSVTIDTSTFDFLPVT